jgi:hypothetical protein
MAGSEAEAAARTAEVKARGFTVFEGFYAPREVAALRAIIVRATFGCQGIFMPPCRFHQ